MTAEPAASLSLHDLFLAEESRLLRYAMRLSGGDFATAQDFVQDAFLRLHAQGAAVVSPRAWLFTAIRNLAFNHRRKHARLAPLDSAAAAETNLLAAEGEDGTTPSDNLEHEEAVLLLRLCVDELPANDRLLVKLKFEDDLSYAEIARASGLTPSNVGFRLSTIVKRITTAFHRAETERTHQ
ncbi:MAG: sigma-70 family RNA polymerase sigma factor [Puniceicoccales bacterium]|nr:sigma-70 family RNA polymerase sigma factor [Puniceicoccales bacterium]